MTALDPRLTIVRSHDAGAEFYDAVVNRINAQPEVRDEDNGVMFHFSGNHGDEFFVVSAYRDPEVASSMFAEFTSPQVANVISETSSAADISRDEFEITSYAVNDDENLQGFRFTKPGEFVAVLVTDEAIQRERYIQTTRRARFPEEWPEGLVIHVAGMFGSHWGVFDLWRADADIEGFYSERIEPAVKALYPDLVVTGLDRPQAIAVHSLHIDRTQFSDAAEYLREE